MGSDLLVIALASDGHCFHYFGARDAGCSVRDVVQPRNCTMMKRWSGNKSAVKTETGLSCNESRTLLTTVQDLIQSATGLEPSVKAVVASKGDGSGGRSGGGGGGGGGGEREAAPEASSLQTDVIASVVNQLLSQDATVSI